METNIKKMKGYQELFVISDLHLGHKKAYEFLDGKGCKMRDFAKDSDEGNEYIIKQWNSVVTKEDKTFILGDVAFNSKKLPLLDRMNGSKVLVAGNHDKYRTKKYLDYFLDVTGAYTYSFEGVKIVMTHVPIHPSCLDRWALNIHGHTHNRSIADNRYFNVCVEQLDCTPIRLHNVIEGSVKEKR